MTTPFNYCLRYYCSIIGIFALTLTGCSTVRESLPARTATEQLLLSTAADHAAQKLAIDLPKHHKIFLDTQYFDTVSTDAKYAIGAIKNQLLTLGYPVVRDRKEADSIIEIRLGALSINQHKSRWLGLPDLNVPIPLTGTIPIPEIVLLGNNKLEGIAKIGLSVYDAKEGTLESVIEPSYGFSRFVEWTVLLISWTDSDLVPENARDEHESLRLHERLLINGEF
ncbi:DUF6655 family protein [Methylotuvimicrobium buryatense]|uniref:Uncharacterized protein n=1 Tax=Methylotuvimicrobium buryatense TaxID=95641 RepID=A0A4V1IJW6_METBY|nr:DUF6655 family protein [Methylotuvimicrobium buryatense]QCW82835.1 hypothetical protein EQU24_11715 [Methylotuvimicrobium buryatense]